MDAKFALLKEGDEGIYYFIPLCREGATPEQVMELALEYIARDELLHDYDGDLDFTIVEVASTVTHNTSAHQDFFEKLAAERDEQLRAAQKKSDEAQYELLRKRLGKAT